QRILGLIYLGRRDYQKAVFHLDRADLDAQVLEGLIRGYLALGKLREAMEQAELLGRIKSPTATLTQVHGAVMALKPRRADVLKEWGVPPGADGTWGRAVDALLCAEHAFAEEASAAQVESLLAPAFAESAEVGPAFAFRAWLQVDKGRLARALADAEKAIQLSPKDPRGYYVRGRVRLERASEGALADLEKGVTLSLR